MVLAAAREVCLKAARPLLVTSPLQAEMAETAEEAKAGWGTGLEAARPG